MAQKCIRGLINVRAATDDVCRSCTIEYTDAVTWINPQGATANAIWGHGQRDLGPSRTIVGLPRRVLSVTFPEHSA